LNPVIKHFSDLYPVDQDRALSLFDEQLRIKELLELREISTARSFKSSAFFGLHRRQKSDVYQTTQAKFSKPKAVALVVVAHQIWLHIIP
jgi:hypothetical protein